VICREEEVLQSRDEQTAAPEAKTALTTELKHGTEYVSLRWGGGVAALGNTKPLLENNNNPFVAVEFQEFN
jgi:hypothetical protein